MSNEVLILKLDQARGERNGIEFWMARDIQRALGYHEWRQFEAVIRKAVLACESIQENPSDHFVKTTKMVRIGSGASRPQTDYFLSRFGSYLQDEMERLKAIEAIMEDRSK